MDEASSDLIFQAHSLTNLLALAPFPWFEATGRYVEIKISFTVQKHSVAIRH